MIPWVVNYRLHSRQSRWPRLLPYNSLTSITRSLSSTSFISHLPYLLPSSVSYNSFVCHSYENCRGVYQQFPFRNYELCARQPDQFARSCRSFLPLWALSVLWDLCVSLFFQLSTLDSQPLFPPTHLLSFQIFAHSFALSCTFKKTQLVSFQAIPDSLPKNSVCGEGGQFAKGE